MSQHETITFNVVNPDNNIKYLIYWNFRPHGCSSYFRWDTADYMKDSNSFLFEDGFELPMSKVKYVLNLHPATHSDGTII